MNPINLVDLSRLFTAGVRADTARQAEILGRADAADRARVERVLADLLDAPEDTRMLRLPMTDTDMVDFEIEEEAAPR
ncbi:hypothetical protein [Streptomyces sp. ACT015]|uniref:hypothetical protein n=1 Tax=Streptomyces sp. ACT015 TaxID=3134807 RepID=UPI003D1874CB